MCQPASPGSTALGNRTGSVPPTPCRRIQRPTPRSLSYTLQRVGDVPAAANAGPSGQEIRTTGLVQVAGSCGSMDRSRRASATTSTHRRTASAETASRTVTKPFVQKSSMRLAIPTRAQVCPTRSIQVWIIRGGGGRGRDNPAGVAGAAGWSGLRGRVVAHGPVVPFQCYTGRDISGRRPSAPLSRGPRRGPGRG